MSIQVEYTKTSPYPSRILKRWALTSENSSKETYHIVLDLTDSGISYSVGDSIAILPDNPPSLVERILKAIGADGSEMTYNTKLDTTLAISEFLIKKANIARLTPGFIKLWLEHLQDDSIKEKIEATLLNPASKREFMKGHEPLELLEMGAHKPIPLEKLGECFAPLLPRFYSIASSQKVCPTEVHLTVTTSPFKFKGEVREGVATHFLCHNAGPRESTIPLYIQPNHGFTLPENHETHMIMIGPGTGIAPFRAFLEERMHLSATGKNWLFFGERSRKNEFYYQDELEAWEKDGFLKLSTAFSRDQEEKIYVQHLMANESKDFWAWIQDGAKIFICGDAHCMAKDVQAELHNIAMQEGGLSDNDAKEFIKQMRKDKRLLLDVY